MKDDELLNVTSDPKPDQPVVMDKSQDYGLLGLAVIFVVLVVFNLFKGQPIADLNAIFWGYLGMSYISKYRHEKSTTNLVAGICGLIASLASLASYILSFW
jgi:hypothetical protein